MASPESWQKPEQQSLSQVVQAESVNLSQSVQAYFQPLRERSEIRQGLPLALDLGSMSDLCIFAWFLAGKSHQNGHRIA
jgi:hypothetical protein